MKYIDADRLRAEIEKNTSNSLQLLVYRDIVLSLIDSLQQDKELLELCSKIWWEEQGWIMIPPGATIEGIDSLLRQVKKKLQQEQLEVDATLNQKEEK